MGPLLFSYDKLWGFFVWKGGFSLFADNSAIKRGKNLEFIVKKLQKAIVKIEEWSFEWGFKISVDKTKTMIFTRERVAKE